MIRRGQQVERLNDQLDTVVDAYKDCRKKLRESQKEMRKWRQRAMRSEKQVIQKLKKHENKRLSVEMVSEFVREIILTQLMDYHSCL